MADLKPLEWRNNRLILLDQTCLPGKEKYIEISDYAEVVSAIKRLAVRGAPAIGVAAAYAIVLGSRQIKTQNKAKFLKELAIVNRKLAESRPTARNLFWAIEIMNNVTNSSGTITSIRKDLIEKALKIHSDQMESDLKMAKLGSLLFKDGDILLTHCNTGALATAGYGSALGVIKQTYIQRKNIRAIATETRPLLQGARLTSYELQKAGVPFTLITDSMAGSFMSSGNISAVIVGADRIASNGDTANKIGTYSLAVLAKAHNIPFYIAAPMSTVDTSLPSGDEIIIEERKPEEITHIQGVRIAPEGINVANPSFDVTPHEYITAIITEKGIIKEPFRSGLREIKDIP
jgi:methylthioribose-1-phosphate isomerase